MSINTCEFCRGVDRPLVKGLFTADASTTTGAAQYIPPGGALCKAGAGAGITVTSDQTIIEKMRIRFTGDSSNGAGQLAVFQLLKNGVAIASAVSSGIATTAGVKTASVAFTATTIAEGDLIQCTVTPSAGLTAALTDLSVTLG